MCVPVLACLLAELAAAPALRALRWCRRARVLTDPPPPSHTHTLTHAHATLCRARTHTPQQKELSPQLQARLQAIAAGTAVDPRAVSAIVKDLMTADEDLEEAEVPLRARRNPVVAAAAVSGR
jgi:hypothetical protein